MFDTIDSGGEYVRKQDLFGTNINLKYKNESTYKTIPGGCLSILFKFLLIGFFLVELASYLYMRDAKISSVDLLQNYEQLEHTHSLNQEIYANLSMGVQIVPKKPR